MKMGIVYNNTGKSLACILFAFYLVAKEFRGCFKRKFWCSVCLTFVLLRGHIFASIEKFGSHL